MRLLLCIDIYMIVTCGVLWTTLLGLVYRVVEISV